MGLEIQLNDPLLVQLYRKSLYQMDEDEPVINKEDTTESPVVIAAEPQASKIKEKASKEKKESTTEQTAPLPKLGGFEKKVAILVEDNFFPVIADENLAFLTKILSACKLSMADVAIININGVQHLASSIKSMQPASVILLGVELERLELPMRFPNYQVQRYDQCVYLSAPALNEMEHDREAKAQFWESLQRMFNLK